MSIYGRLSAGVALALTCLAVEGLGAESAPPFSLPEWGTGDRVALSDFAGRIVVLDFFSAGCGDCFRASRELEIGVKEFYAARGGNAHGLPVQVVALSTEPAEEDDMAVFIQETGVDLVLDDGDGDVLFRYGGHTVPYVVVVDATRTGAGSASARVVYRQSGLQGLDGMRKAIDGIGGTPATVEADAAVSGLFEQADERQTVHETGFDFAMLAASDVLVTDTVVEYRHTRPGKEFTLSLTHRHIEVEYEAEQFGVARERELSAGRFGAQGAGRFDVSDTLSVTLGGGIYDGHQSYRSLWLDEYYRHMADVLKEDMEELKGYEEADPWGCNVSTGLRWEYLPDAGFAEATVSYLYDVVSPGYEIGVPLIRLGDHYDTVSGNLAFENVLTRRVRTKVECRIDDTTDREWRYTVQGSLNYALAEHWVVRLTAARAEENPCFKSTSFSGVLERDWHGTWFASLFARYYEDNGEIVNAIAGNAAAPPLETYQAGLGLRWQGRRSSLKLVAGPCFSRYDSECRRDPAFDQLYQDRDWLAVQLAFVHTY
jgi:thiol-disulfide isomerase/thioredoxin